MSRKGPAFAGLFVLWFATSCLAQGDAKRGQKVFEVCSACHTSEREFWNHTQHSSAYATLSSAHKEFNLDCVSCHVTGYDRPGGSTVVHVENLRDVQCEVCHGPGSGYVAALGDAKLIAMPEQSLCAAQCHHEPHVKADWSVVASWAKIIGPGHQRPPSAASK